MQIGAALGDLFTPLSLGDELCLLQQSLLVVEMGWGGIILLFPPDTLLMMRLYLLSSYGWAALVVTKTSDREDHTSTLSKSEPIAGTPLALL